MKYLIPVLLALVCFGSVGAQESVADATPIIAEIFLAKPNLEGKAGEAADKFLVTDIPIFCVVRFNSSGAALVKMDLFAAKVPGVKPETKVVSTSYTTRSDEDRVNFSGRPHGLWVAGIYRVDIFIDGKKVRNIEFEIKAASTEAEKPRNFQPTRKPRKRSIADDGYAQKVHARAFL